MIHGVVGVGLKVILHVTLFFRPIALRQSLVSHNALLLVWPVIPASLKYKRK